MATLLDVETLRRRRVTIYPASTSLGSMSPLSGAQLKRQMGVRYLIRYLRPYQLGKLTSGVSSPQFVTPTPYSPQEAVSWLALPDPANPPTYVLFLDPAGLKNVYGPRWVRLGSGIEYILQTGFSAADIVSVAPGSPAGTGVWELELK